MHPWLLASTGVGTLLLIGSAFVLLQQMRQQRQLTTRIQASRGLAPAPAGTRQEAAHRAWTNVVAALGQVILRTWLLSARTRTGLEQTLTSAGVRGRNGL